MVKLFGLCCLLLFVTRVSECRYVQTLGVQLTGKEILCELSPQGKSASAPGIYALDPETLQFMCVIPNAQKPVWSPDHKQFVYWCDGLLWVANRETKLSVLAYERYKNSAPVDADIVWDPSSRGIIYHVSETPYPSRKLVLADDQGQRRLLWDNNSIEQIGAVSLSSDGKYAAYESCVIIPGRGVIPAKIGVASVGTADCSFIADQLSGAIVYNPQWKPGTKILAFDAFMPDTKTNAVYLYDANEKALSRLSLQGRIAERDRPLPLTLEENSHKLLGWSPDGKQLLVQMRSPMCGVRTLDSLLYLIPYDDVKAPIRGILGPLGYLHFACISPDGTKVIYMKTDSLNLESSRQISLVLYKSSDGSLGEIRPPLGLIPTAIHW